MINKKQLVLSLCIGAGLILIKLVTLALASPNNTQLQTVSSLFSMGMWYVPLLFVLLYYFVYFPLTTPITFLIDEYLFSGSRKSSFLLLHESACAHPAQDSSVHPFVFCCSGMICYLFL